MFSSTRTTRLLVLTAITFGGIAGSAYAAESSSSSMAGGMAGSSAEMGATTDSNGAMGGMSGSQASWAGSSSSGTTQRASVADAQNSASQPAPPPLSPELSVRNASAISPANNNPTRSSGNITGRPATSSSNSLIENTVKPLADEPTRATTTTNSVNQGQGVAAGAKVAPTARVPHNKVQYWNQRTSRRTR
jgi:hypothetical protein